jgi:hypothetical protein
MTPEPTQAHCLSCNTDREMRDIVEIILPLPEGPRSAWKGYCVICGTEVYIIAEVSQER